MRNPECSNYNTCLDVAAKNDDRDFTCGGCDGTILFSEKKKKRGRPKLDTSAYEERTANRTTLAQKRIYVNFDSHPDLYDAVHKEAEEKFRSVNGQFLYWIKKAYEASQKEEP